MFAAQVMTKRKHGDDKSKEIVDEFRKVICLKPESKMDESSFYLGVVTGVLNCLEAIGQTNPMTCRLIDENVAVRMAGIALVLSHDTDKAKKTANKKGK